MSRLTRRLSGRSLFLSAAVLALPVLTTAPVSAKGAPIRMSAPADTSAQGVSGFAATPSQTEAVSRTLARDFYYPDEQVGFITSTRPVAQFAAMAVPETVFETDRKIGKPYQIADKVYRPEADPYYDEIGVASWYGSKFHGRDTANGEVFDMTSITAAHPTLPIPSLVQVVNLENGREVVVRINDRGPFAKDRIIDLSRAAARALDMEHEGHSEVRVRYLGPAPKIPVTRLAKGAGADAVRSSREARSAFPSVNGQYYVQAGSFQSMDNAKAMQSTLSVQFKDADIVSAFVKGKNHFRVMIGPFSDRNTAETTNLTLASRASVTGLVIHNP